MVAGPFDVTADDVQRLNNVQLRDVLRLLLEAEARQRGIPQAAIFIGGDQNAADGGVDGRVEWVGDPEPAGWVPCRKTLFQSKAEEMAPADLRRELASNGAPRAFFEGLARLSGAYIVFSINNCSDAMHQRRIDAMRDVVADVPLSGQIMFDFYDASRIARWVNCFHGVANEVRNVFGRPMVGWHPLENWSAPELADTPAYIPDDRPKFSVGGGELRMITDAIDSVRELLRNHGSATRLIGLSGVGKTRFAQALFDELVGQNALSGEMVVYGDLSQSPATIPAQIAEQLVHAQQDAILIVDNCPGNTHRALTQITQRAGSRVGLLTIDFDVGPDQPDNTQVLQLYKNGNELIEALLSSRVPMLTPQDRTRVAAFSDGNARIALAIANNCGEGESLAELSDRQLIDRLFLEGRRPVDGNLRRCAEVASLVYAFYVDPEVAQAPEHPILAELAEVSQISFYRYVAECVERGTAQKRGTQRAILPHALAIRLAIRALDRLPPDEVLAHFNQDGRERLFRSFTRRLGDLHQSEPARTIAQRLMVPNGMLSDLTTFTDNEFTLFDNVAPVVPELALAAMERAVYGPQGAEFTLVDHPHRRRLTSLACNLAYDAAYFDRAVRLLLAFAKVEPENYGFDQIRSQFFELFWIVLSGTQAPPEQRYRFIDQLLAEAGDTEQLLAVQALSHALDTGSKVSSRSYEFGSRRRGEEWRPRTIEEQNSWFREALNRLVPIACQDGEIAVQARSAIAGEIRGLSRIELVRDLVSAVRVVREAAFWPEGWKALCMALHFDRNKWSQNTRVQLDQLEGVLRPATIDEQFTAYVLGDPWGLYSPNPEDGGREERRLSHLAEELGQEIGPTSEVWLPLARQACAHMKSGSCADFGRGLGQTVHDVVASWAHLVAIFGELELESRNPSILCGFLSAAHEREPDVVQGWLDEAIADRLLGPHIVDLSVSLPIDRRSIDRLTEAVRLNASPISRFRLLSSGGRTDTVPPDALVEFLRELTNRGGEGAAAAADVLSMYCFARQQQPDMSAELVDMGRELLQTPGLYHSVSQNNYSDDMENIAGRCLVGVEAEPQARAICEMLLALVRDDRSLGHRLEGFLRRLAELQPIVALDVAFGSDEDERVLARWVFGYTDNDEDSDSHPSINENTHALVEWTNENPEVRAVSLARHVRYTHQNDHGVLSWSPIANELISLPQVRIAVLDVFYRRFHVGSATGPWHLRYVRRRSLLESLSAHPDLTVRAWASDKLMEMNELIDTLINEERREDERFE